MKPEPIAAAIDAGFEAVKGYVDRGFAIVEERLAAIEKRFKEADIEAEVQRRINLARGTAE